MTRGENQPMKTQQTIRPEELKKYNYVFYPFLDKIIQVKEIHEYSIKYYSEHQKHEVSFLDLEPIELTGEILLRLGFEKCQDSSFELDKVSIFLDKRFKENIFLETINGGSFGESVYNKLDNIKILYLHELQNLFYATTGKELKLKPKE